MERSYPMAPRNSKAWGVDRESRVSALIPGRSVCTLLSMDILWVLVPTVLIINLPFGYWPTGVRRFSPAWFVAVHAPIPLIALLRIASGIGWQISTFPLFVLAYFLGQFLGGRIRRRSRQV